MASPGSLAARAVLVAVALAAALSVVSWQSTEDDCREAGATVVREITGTESAANLPGAFDTLRGDCHDVRPLLVAAGQLARAERRDEALPLARRAVRREPDDFAAWAVLSEALAEADPAAARRARRRALALNPRAGG
jgi:tetratricopeptide (TPR) repeat protein